MKSAKRVPRHSFIQLLTLTIFMSGMALAGIVWSRTSSAQQSCATAPSGLVAWYKGNGNANDSVGGNNGTLQNGATFAPGEVGQAFNFDGNQSVRVPNSPSLNPTGSFSIDAWIYPTGDSQNGGIVYKWGELVHRQSEVEG